MSALDVVKAHYSASDAGNVAGMVADFAPDVSWTEAAGFPYAGTYRSAEAIIAAVFAKLPQDFDNFVVVRNSFVSEGNEVVMLGRYQGVSKVTGKPFDVAVCHSWTVQNGKIVRFEQIVDSAPVLAVMS